MDRTTDNLSFCLFQPSRVFFIHYCLGLILALHKLIHFGHYFHFQKGYFNLHKWNLNVRTFESHLFKLKPPFLNSCTDFSLIYLTYSRLLTPGHLHTYQSLWLWSVSQSYPYNSLNACFVYLPRWKGIVSLRHYMFWTDHYVSDCLINYLVDPDFQTYLCQVENVLLSRKNSFHTSLRILAKLFFKLIIHCLISLYMPFPNCQHI